MSNLGDSQYREVVNLRRDNRILHQRIRAIKRALNAALEKYAGSGSGRGHALYDAVHAVATSCQALEASDARGRTLYDTVHELLRPGFGRER